MKKFRTKIDFWVYLLILFFVAVIVYCFFHFFSEEKNGMDIFTIIFLTTADIVVIAMCFCTYYVFESDNLYVRTLFSKTRIPYSQILLVKTSISLWAAPVLSVFRILIAYGKGGDALITPIKQKEFLELLREKMVESQNTNFEMNISPRLEDKEKK